MGITPSITGTKVSSRSYQRETIITSFSLLNSFCTTNLMPSSIRSYNTINCLFERQTYMKLILGLDECTKEITVFKHFRSLFRLSPRRQVSNRPICCLVRDTVTKLRQLFYNKTYFDEGVHDIRGQTQKCRVQ